MIGDLRKPVTRLLRTPLSARHETEFYPPAAFDAARAPMAADQPRQGLPMRLPPPLRRFTTRHSLLPSEPLNFGI